MTTPPPFRIGQARVEPASSTILMGDDARHVSPKSMDVLLCLAERAGDLVSVKELMDTVWGDTVVSDSSVYERIKELRRAFDDTPQDSQVILTVPKRGYRLIASVNPDDLPDKRGVITLTKKPVWAVGFATLVIAVSVAALCAYHDYQRDSSPSNIGPTIAVLPFATLHVDGDQTHLGETIADEVIHALSNTKDLRVIARTSSFGFKDSNLGAKSIGEQLGASFLLEGSVSQDGDDQLRFIAHLVDTDSGMQILSRSYSADMATLAAIPAGIAVAVRQQVSGAANFSIGDPRPSPGSRAYDQFLLGVHFLNRRSTPRDAENAIHYFERAISADENFARAHVGLARALTHQDALRRFTTGQEGVSMPPRAVALTERALQLDPDLADARAMLASKAMFDDDLDLAEEMFNAAVASDPNLVEAYRGLATIYGLRERHDKAVSILREALTRDPRSPGLLFDLQFALRQNGDFQMAMSFAEHAVAIDPDATSPFYWLASYKTALGQPDAAIRILHPLIGDPRFEAEQLQIHNWLALSYMDLGHNVQAGHMAEYAESLGNLPLVFWMLAQGENVEDEIHERVKGELPYHGSLYEAIIGHESHALELYEKLRSMERLDYPGALYWGYYPSVHAARLHLSIGDIDLGQTMLEDARNDLQALLNDPLYTSGAYYALASIEAIGGNHDAAMTYLDRAQRSGWCRTWFAKLDPSLRAVRNRPMFDHLLRQVEANMRTRSDQLGAFPAGS